MPFSSTLDMPRTDELVSSVRDFLRSDVMAATAGPDRLSRAGRGELARHRAARTEPGRAATRARTAAVARAVRLPTTTISRRCAGASSTRCATADAARRTRACRPSAPDGRESTRDRPAGLFGTEDRAGRLKVRAMLRRQYAAARWEKRAHRYATRLRSRTARRPASACNGVPRSSAAAWAGGVRLFDTAPEYGIGRSERRLGLALAEVAERAAYVINTKVGRTLEPEPLRVEANKTVSPDGGVRTPRDPRSGHRVHFAYDRAAILSQHRDSLTRLGLPYVDSLTIHDIDYGYHDDTQIDAALAQLSRGGGGGAAALEELRAAGSIKAIGLGCNREMRNYTRGAAATRASSSGSPISWTSTFSSSPVRTRCSTRARSIACCLCAPRAASARSLHRRLPAAGCWPPTAPAICMAKHPAGTRQNRADRKRLPRSRRADRRGCTAVCACAPGGRRGDTRRAVC